MKFSLQIKYLISSLFLLLLSACGDGSNSGFPTADCGTADNLCVSELTITPNKATVLIGGEQDYQAIATLTDGSERNVTDLVTWSVDDTSLAVLVADSDSVIATGLSDGTVTILASYRDLNVTAQLSVGAIAFNITPSEAGILTGMHQSYKAFAILPDGVQLEITDQVTWASSQPDVASINANGETVRATGLTSGATSISASYNGESLFAELLVISATPETLVITPASSNMPVGTSLQYNAYLTTETNEVIDVTNSATWTVTDSAIAAIDNTAWLTSVAIGDTQVKASVDHNNNTYTSTAALSVNNATLNSLVVTPDNGKFPVGKIGVYRAEAYFSDGSVYDVTREATWQLADETIGSIVSAGVFAGDSIALSPGKTIVTASLLSVSDTTNVEITNAELLTISLSPQATSTPVGTVVSYQAHAFYSDGSKRDITQLGAWSSSEASIAAISFVGSKSGQANAFAIGTTDISVTFEGLTKSTPLTVTNAVVTRLQISPLNPSVPVGTEGQFIATAYYTDSTTKDVTKKTNWLADDYTIAAVVPTGDFAGYAKAISQGSTVLTAYYNGEVASTTVTVSSAVLESLSLTPAQATIPVGTTQQYQLFGVYSDGTSHDLTAFASYQSNQAVIASIDADALATAHLTANEAVTITASYLDQKTTALLNVSGGILEYIAVEPADKRIAIGHKVNLEARAYYSGGINKDVTKLATWSVEKGDVASVDNTQENAGTVLGISRGSTLVTATFEGELGANLTTVSEAVLESVIITPSTKTIAAGLTLQYQLFAIFSDNSSQDVTLVSDWTSAEPRAVTIDNSGLATTYQEWQTSITGTYQGKSAIASLTINGSVPSVLQITPVNPSKPLGTVGQFFATLFYTDGYGVDITENATWTSNKNDIVQIGATGKSAGLASANKIGTSEISANFSGLSATTTATVTAAILTDIYINPVDSDINVGDKVSYNAICKYSDGSFHNLPSNGEWHSSKTDIANVQLSGVTTAVATGLNEGTTVITASVGDIISNEAMLTVTALPITLDSIKITPSSGTVILDAEYQFKATAYYSDGSEADVTRDSTWLTDNKDIVGITTTGAEAGYAYALGLGSANVTAVFESMTSNSANITVSGKSLDNVQIVPNNKSYTLGDTAQYSVRAIYDDYTSTDVTAFSQIQSLDPDVATLDVNNVMTTLSTGDAELTAVYLGMTSEREFLHVNVAAPMPPTLEITPTNIVVPEGTKDRYTAILHYADSPSKDVTSLAVWSSTDTNIVNITPTGEDAGTALAAGTGNATITASYQGITSNTAKVSVSAKELLSLEIVVEDNASFPKGTTKHYNAYATYSDGSVAEVTKDASWKSENTEIIFGAKGLVYGIDTGITDIDASFEGKTDQQSITVTDAVATSLTITPSYHEMAVHSSIDYTVIATLSDGSTENVTKDVLKSATGTAELTIVNQEDLLVKVEAITSGNSVVQANYHGQVATANLVVLPAALDSISITPLDETITLSSTLQYKAKAHYNDGSEVDITQEASWKSDNSAIAAIENTSVPGLASGVSVGVTTIQASFNGEKTTTSITVVASCGNHKPDSIYIRPENAIISINTEMQYTLYGLWSNGCTTELTKNNAGNWTSSDNKTVSIGKKDGIALAKKVGNTTINASYQNLTASPVNVSVTKEEVLSVSIQPAPLAILAKGASQAYLCSARTAIDGVEQAEKFITGLASFSVSDDNLAVIGSNDGTVQTVTALNISGNTTVNCNYGGKSSSSSLSIQ